MSLLVDHYVCNVIRTLSNSTGHFYDTVSDTNNESLRRIEFRDFRAYSASGGRTALVDEYIM